MTTKYQTDDKGSIIDPPIIPAFEREIQDAALSGDNDAVAEVQTRYDKARRDKAGLKSSGGGSKSGGKASGGGGSKSGGKPSGGGGGSKSSGVKPADGGSSS